MDGPRGETRQIFRQRKRREKTGKKEEEKSQRRGENRERDCLKMGKGKSVAVLNNHEWKEEGPSDLKKNFASPPFLNAQRPEDIF